MARAIGARALRCVVHVVLAAWLAPAASAQESIVTIDLDAHAALPLDAQNSSLYAAGVGGSAGVELHLIPLLGIHASFLGTYYAPQGSAQETSWIGGRAGLRLHFGELFGLGRDAHDAWLASHFSFGRSGETARPGFDVEAGFDLGIAPELRLGPFARYQFGADPLDAHASLLQFGLHVAFLARPVERSDEPRGPADGDRDGVLDEHDACPDIPAGAHPDPERRGCPRADSDHDGVFDSDDACPTTPAGASPDPARRGCPTRDADGDGVPDADDHCPEVPAGASPHPTRAGCPAADTDRDGVVDHEDSCPETPAGRIPDPARAGCPADRDGDTVPDASDNCPDEAGPPENSGCRERQRVRITTEQIQILERVYFATDRATIQRRSFPLLDNVAAVLAAHPEIARVRIEGHTDSRGSAEHNRELSQRRADAVRDYLVRRGIDAARLEARGFGPDRPIVAAAQSEAEHAQNRRVEFNIVEAAVEPE